jgi:pimeloyl-ACP methyl ester carboxylesterase
VPTLLMPGDQDLQAPPWVMRRQLAHIPGAEFIVLPEASHSINWEQPEAFNRPGVNPQALIGSSREIVIVRNP